MKTSFTRTGKFKLVLFLTLCAVVLGCAVLLCFHINNNANTANNSAEITAPELNTTSGGLYAEHTDGEITAPELEAKAAATKIAYPQYKSVTGGAFTCYTTTKSVIVLWSGNRVQADFSTNYNPYYMTISGTGITSTSTPCAYGTDAGVYTIVFTPKSGYTWEDGTTTGYTCTLTIKKQVPKPSFSSGDAGVTGSGQSATAVYTGKSIQSMFATNYDTSAMRAYGTSTQYSPIAHGTNVGEYTVTFKLQDNYEWSDGGTKDVVCTFTITKATLSIPTLTTYSGSPSINGRTATAVCTGGSIGVTLSGYNSSTMSLSTTSTIITRTTAGSSSLTVSLKDTSNYQWSDETTTGKTYTLTLTGKAVSSLSITAPSDQTYTTKALTPKPTVKNGTTTLSEGTHYSLSYTNNTNVGTATVTITGNTDNGYGGTTTVTFKINKLNFTNNTAITASTISAYTYDGNAKTPTPTISYNGTALTKDTHYTLSYNRNTNASTSTAKAQVIVTGKGDNCEGSKTFDFTINKGSITPTLSYGTVTYGTKSGDPTVGGNSGNGTVTYSISTVGCTGSATIDTNGILTPTKAGTVKVTATVAATDNYNSGSKEITVTIGARDIANATIDPVTKTYTGSDITPALMVKDTINGATSASLLVKDTDYTVVFTDNKNVGSKATATLSGTGNYTGEKVFYFTIEQRSITNVTIDPNPIPACTYDGSPQTPTPTVKDGNTVLVEGTDFEYKYENNIEVGTAKLILKGLGNYNDEKPITFSIDPPSVADATVTLSQTVFTYDGTAKEPTVTSVSVAGLTLTEGTDFTVGYSANVKAGTAKVVLTGKGTYAGTKEVEFTINPADLSTAVITGLQLQYTFTGSDIEPNITVTLDGKELVKNTDYLVTYADNLNVGPATLTVTGSKNYTGTLTDNFTIIKASISPATVTGINATYEYTTAAIEPAPAVNWNGILLVKDTDYTVSYSANIELGTVTVTIAGLGNLNGTITKTFEIVQANISTATVTGVNANYTFTGTDIEPTVTVALKGVTLQTTDYTVTYSDNVDKGTATITITGVGNYTGVATVNFNIDEADITTATVTGINASYEYTSTAITPTPVVTWNGTTLVKDTDYSVSYADNIALGTATVTITGIGNYTGTITETFEIEQADVTKATVTGIDSSYTYTGADIEPTVTVTLNGVTLTLNTDYTVAYSDNLNVGTATVTVTCTGNYTGVITENFDIEEADISTATVTGIDAEYAYTTAAITPAPVVTWNNTVLVKDTDYTVSYSDNIALGTATVTITGKGNFDGTITETFEIVQADISTATVTGVNANYTYTGTDIEPTVTVTLNSVTLLTTDYTVTYSDNINKGTATVTVTGIGNYKGTVTVNFVIDEADMDDSTVSGIDNEYEYTGKAITPEPVVTANGITLVKNTDYTVSYSANVDLGTVTITITGKGNFTAVKEVTFEIIAADITNTATLTGVDEEYGYTGSAITPNPVVTVNNTQLVKDTDYTVSYASNTDLGIAVITVQGIGNYTGRKSIAFNIVQADISKATVTGINASYEWTGAAIEPNPTTTLNKVTLVKDQDYTLVLTDNTDIGTASYTVTGIGNYTGSIEGTFEIVKAKLLVDVVYIDYNGTAQLFAGNELPKIIAVATRKDDGTTTVSGSVAWDNEIDGTPIALKLGKFKYGWTFTPADTDHYEVTTGENELTAGEPNYIAIRAEWKNGAQPELFTSTSITVIKQNLKITGILNNGTSNEIIGGYSVKGSWDTSSAANTVALPTSGGNNYSIEVIFGQLSCTDLIEIVIKDVVLTGLTADGVDGGDITTDYTALDAFDTSSVVVTAKYNDGSEKTVALGKNGYKVVYEQGTDSLQYGDTKVTLSYTEKGVTKTVDIEDISVEKKAFTGTLVLNPDDTDYNGKSVSGIIAVENMPSWLKVTYVYTDEAGNEIAAANVKNAGTYKVTAKFTVDDNHAPVDDVTATFTINKIEPTLTPAVGGSFSEGTLLSDLPISANSEGTTGTLTWDNGAYALKSGINRCYYTFTPDDTVNYKVVHGYVDITTELPQPAVPAENNGASVATWQIVLIIIICIIVAIIAIVALVMALKSRRSTDDSDGFYDDATPEQLNW
ncbi:MAG: hypothetical protein K2O28_04755 [Clostridia bacterium]|nr:hypothetical protein [Clostridia bacterium]